MDEFTPQMIPVDLSRGRYAHDGLEPDDYGLLLELPGGKPSQRFSLSEICRNPFEALRGILGGPAFDVLVAAHGFRIPVGEFETWVGEGDLSLYYFLRDSDLQGSRELVVVAFGEFQPARYKVYIEGIWLVSNLPHAK